MKYQPPHEAPAHLGFQIAPMIDVVFVIMLFFMAIAGAIKSEQRLSLQLPGTPKLGDAQMPGAEITIRVDQDGSIALNDEVLGGPQDKRLTAFRSSMARMQQHAASIHDKVLVTIQADDQASYQRVMDVLDVLAEARLTNITFTVGSGGA